MADLATRYLGLTLKNPLIASSSPLTQKLEMVRRLEEAGAAAVVLPSLFEEQITCDLPAAFLGSSSAYAIKPEEYLEYVTKLKKEVKIPIIASLNGISTGGWLVWARRLEEAGADALELNTYYVASNPEQTAQTIEDMHGEVVRMVRSILSIPLAVKLSFHFSAFAHMARRLSDAGADGLVLFNRFYQPDIDIESRQVAHRLSLSTSEELLLRLRWVALLHGRVKSDLSVTGGIHRAEDVIKSIMAGASAVMMASALIRKGIEIIPVMLSDLTQWLQVHGFRALDELKGIMGQGQVDDPGAYERAQYMKTLGAVRRAASLVDFHNSGEL
jgi:dihydroorotate dehydrogenase (fumarate)